MTKWWTRLLDLPTATAEVASTFDLPEDFARHLIERTWIKVESAGSIRSGTRSINYYLGLPSSDEMADEMRISGFADAADALDMCLTARRIGSP